MPALANMALVFAFAIGTCAVLLQHAPLVVVPPQRQIDIGFGQNRRPEASAVFSLPVVDVVEGNVARKDMVLGAAVFRFFDFIGQPSGLPLAIGVEFILPFVAVFATIVEQQVQRPDPEGIIIVLFIVRCGRIQIGQIKQVANLS